VRSSGSLTATITDLSATARRCARGVERVFGSVAESIAILRQYHAADQRGILKSPRAVDAALMDSGHKDARLAGDGGSRRNQRPRNAAVSARSCTLIVFS
jgi:hypothetical protein